jgi:Tol biopolymer transport system component
MSPEQAEGRDVDARSDIFSLGVLLYEMATGERPFKGDSSISLLSAILRDTPKPISDLNPRLPRELVRIVRRCLAKDRDERYQSAADLKNDLEDLRQSASSGELSRSVTAIPAPARAPRWAAALLLAVAAVAAMATVAWPRRAADQLPMPQLSFSRLTLLAGVANEPAISPDGKWVAYVNNGDIYLQSTTGETAINLTKDTAAADRMPAFSPDGELIVFRSERDGGGLFVMGRTGESVRRISRSGVYPSWFPDGKRVVYGTVAVGVPESRGGGVSELWSVDINGGEPQLVFRGDAMQPRVSPNGRRIAYWAMPMDEALLTFAGANRDVWTIGIDGTGAVRVTTEESTDYNPVWSPSGDALYFLSDRAGSMNLWRTAVDENTGAPIGQAHPLTAPESYVRDFSLSADGRLGTYANFATTGNLSRVRFDARSASPQGVVEHITTGPRDFIALDVNRHNEVVLMKAFTQQEDLVVAADAGLRHLIKDRFRDRNPRWSPDGKKVYFYSDRGRHYEVYSIDRDGGGLRRLTDTGGNRFYPVPSPDGSKLASSNIRTFDLYIYDTTDFSKPPEALPKLPESMRGGTFVVVEWSPDGNSIAGLSGPNVWVYSRDTRSYRLAGRAGGAGPGGVQWLPDSRRLVLSRQGRLYVRDLASDSEREIMSLPGENITTIDFSPDRSYLYFVRGNATGDIWLVRFDDGSSTDADAR